MKKELERLKLFRKTLNLSQENFGKPLDSKQSSISDVERGKVGISSDLLRGLILIYRLNPFWLFFGKPPMQISATDVASFTNEKVAYKKIENVSTLADDGSMIPLTSSNLVIPTNLHDDYVQAVISGHWDSKGMRTATFAKLPGVSGQLRTFQLRGDSMSPAFMHGDYVCCKQIANLQTARNNGTYLLVCENDGLHLARIARSDRKQLLRLSFENTASGDSFDLPYAQVLEIWEVQLRLTAVFHAPFEQRLQALEERLRLLPPSGS